VIQNFLLYSFPKHLIYLIPVFLITGPFLSDLAVTIVSIIFIIIIFNEKNFEVFKNKFFYIFIIFYFYININSIFQNQNLDSIRISITFIRFGLFCLAFIYFLEKDITLLKKIFYCLLFVFTILVCDGFLQYFTGKNIFGWKLIYPGPRVSSLFGEELILGSFVTRMYPLLIGLLFFFNFSKNKKLLFSLFTFAILFLVLISGERTAFFLMIILFILMFFLIYKNKKFIRNIFLVVLTLSILILSLSGSIKKRIIDVTIEQMLTPNSDKKIYILSKQHDEHYTSAIRMFKNYPIFGVGVKNFRIFCKKEEFYISDYTCSPHPHSTYIQLLSETGLIGFLIVSSIFIFINFRLFLHLKGNYKNNPLYSDLQICLLISVYLTLWPIVPSGNFFNNWLSVVYFYPVGILLWSLKHKNKLINFS